MFVFADRRLQAFELNAHGASPRPRREHFRITLLRQGREESGDARPFVLYLDRATAKGEVFLHFGQKLYRLPER